MTVRRISALLTGLLAMVLTVATATMAAAADYPPSVEGTSNVQGSSTPSDVAGLPHTGFAGGSLMWIALGLLALGAVMVVMTRRRSHA